ncbi:MAG: BatD family protein [Pseudomonadota bacterium]|nr:BatD family protein [Pseudomonadota bacterium]
MTAKATAPFLQLPALLRAILAGLVIAGISGGALAGDLRAYFDRKAVHEGDTVTLVIESESGGGEEPDLSALGTDFDVLGTSQGTQISIINGRRTDTTRWLVTLTPKRTGTIEVPSLAVGSGRTPPLTLQVSEVSTDAVGQAGDDLFVEVELGASGDSVIVQQQVPVTVRLLSTVPLLKGSLSEPRPAGAVVEKLGKDLQYETRRDGREYQVVERRYVLSPEKSGELRIPPVVFKGSVRSAKGRGGGFGGAFGDPTFDRLFNDGFFSRDPFGMFERGEPVRAQSRAITLDVQARPESYAGAHWLPAEQLDITDSWAEAPPELRVGEPVTRTLTLEARGLAGPQIPEIEIPGVAGVRAYPEETETESRTDGETIFGISRQSVTLIPTREGDLDLPAIRVAWWDTVAQEERVADLPGWRVKVGEGSAPQAAPAPLPTDTREEAPVKREASTETSEAGGHGNATDNRLLIGGGLLLLVLATLSAGLTLHRRRSVATKAAKGQSAKRSRPTPRAGDAKRSLHRACEANDFRGAAKALHVWAAATWPKDPPRNLGALAARMDRGADEIRELERRLYAPEAGLWEGAPLWRALRAGLLNDEARRTDQTDALEPLYPRRA